METTKQVKKVPNPTGKGGFQERPEDRSNGHWRKEDSISYQYNMLMRLDFDELKTFKPKSVAQKIALQRVMTAITNEGLHDTKEITDRTEGRAPQAIDITTGGEKLNVAMVEFVDGNSKNKNKDTD